MEHNTLHRTKKAVYVVLLVVALLASGYAIYRQLTAEDTKQDLASQVNQACAIDRVGSLAKGLNCDQAKAEDASPGTVTLPPPPPITQYIPGPTTIVEVPQAPVTITSPLPVPVPTIVPGPTQTQIQTETQTQTNTATETQTETETVTPPPTTTTEPPVTTTTTTTTPPPDDEEDDGGLIGVLNTLLG